MKSIKVKEVTPLTDHESTMGRGGIFKVKIAQGKGIYEAMEIPVKTYSTNAQNRLVQLLQHKGNAELVLFTKQ